MKSTGMLAMLGLALSLMVWKARISEAAPMGTAFTYQGRLIDVNNPADGIYDLQFKLYDAPDDEGIQLGGDVNKPDVDIIDGYFTVELDFGSDVFDGNSVWLDIGVRPGDVNDAYTVLYPRHQITAVPYALQTRGIFVGSSGTVGIGTNTPDRNLDIRHSNTGGGIEIDRSSSNIWSGLIYENDKEEKWFVGVKPDSNNLLFKSDISGISMLIENETGNVGIGIGTPDAPLSVVGGNWDLSSTEGDFKIGDAKYRLKIGAATSGVGAGDVRIRAHGGTNRLILGHDVSDILTLSNKQVGLGTITPDRNLDIRHSNSGGGIEIDRSANTIWSGIVYENNGAENWFIGMKADSDNLLFKDNAAGVSMVIEDETGYVGIGTESPTCELEVNGTGYFTGDLKAGNNISASNLSGCEYTVGEASYNDVPTTPTNICSVNLDLTSSGYVIVTFSGSARIDTDGGCLYAAVDDTASSWDSRIGCSSAAPGYYVPFSVQYVYTVSSPGTYTYYGNAYSTDSQSDVRFGRITAIFVQNHY